MPKYQGVQMTLGGDEYIIPPLNFGRVRKLMPMLEKIATWDPRKIPNAEQLDSVIEILHSAISRNYPEITKEQVEEIIDFSNAPGVIAAIMGASGLVQKQGETQAGNQSTGTGSTAT